jgi:hypothetical protein
MSNAIESSDDRLLSKDKYDKLVQDNTKQRNKLSVLKKAYVELNEKTTYKDQVIRKYEQEIESLNFRNKQLVTRISLLQEQQSDDVISSSAQAGTLLYPISDEVEVLREEFMRKINENALLHQRINEYETSADERTKLIHADMAQLKSQNDALENFLADNERKYATCEEKINGLENKLFFYDNLSMFNENILKILSIQEEKIDYLFNKTSDEGKYPFDLVNKCRSFSLNDRNFFKIFIQSYNNCKDAMFDKELTFYGSNFDAVTSVELRELNGTLSLIIDRMTTPNSDLEVNLKNLIGTLNEILVLKHQFDFKQSLLTLDECLVFYLQKNFTLFVKFNEYLVESNANNNEEIIVLDDRGHKCRCQIGPTIVSNTYDQAQPIVDNKDETTLDPKEPVEYDDNINLNKTSQADGTMSNDGLNANNSVTPNDELISYYTTQICNLEANLEYVSGKAICFHDELNTFKSLFDLNEIRFKDLQQDNTSLKSHINRLTDELETISRHYEDQLRTMSEHIAQLNDKLAEQNEIIERSNSHGSNKLSRTLSKKGK